MEGFALDEKFEIKLIDNRYFFLCEDPEQAYEVKAINPKYSRKSLVEDIENEEEISLERLI